MASKITTFSHLAHLRLPSATFKASLFTLLHDTWFAGLSPSSTCPTQTNLGNWYGLDRTKEQKVAFDDELRSKFGEALEILSPSNYPLPELETYKIDRENAEITCMPLRMVEGLRSADEEERAKTARGLVLLLDQVSRNIDRDATGQNRVYSHYDRLARSLVWSMLRPFDAPVGDAAADVRGLDAAGSDAKSPAHRMWLYMPLMHSEDSEDHDAFDDQLGKLRKQVSEKGDGEAVAFLDDQRLFEKRHRSIIDQFGRYPHRNTALGRRSTDEETKYLDEGGERFTS